MIDQGRHPVLGVRIAAMDYEAAVQTVILAAKSGQTLSVTALAVHGVMTGVLDPMHRRRLNGVGLVLPDGQPVRWALRWLHGVRLPDRVCGPLLTLKLLQAAAQEQLPVFFYGSTAETLRRLGDRMRTQFPGLQVAGAEPSRFRRLAAHEKQQVIDQIKASGARLVFVGLGCPRQEVWVYEYQHCLSLPLLAVGAAFSFHAGVLAQAPAWMQRWGLEWLFRFLCEPTRLWRRYLFLNPLYLGLLLLAKCRLVQIPVLLPAGDETELSYG